MTDPMNYLTEDLSFAERFDELGDGFSAIPRLAGAEQVVLRGGEPSGPLPAPLSPSEWVELCVVLAAIAVDQGRDVDDIQRALIQADTLGELGYALRLLALPDASLSAAELRAKRHLQDRDAPVPHPNQPTQIAPTLNQLVGLEAMPNQKEKTMPESLPEPDLGPPPCSLCGGKHLHDLLHQHRVDCSRYAAELSPREADFRDSWRRSVRAATPTELEVIAEHGYESPGEGEGYKILVENTPLYVRRVLISSGLKGNLRPAERITEEPTTIEEEEAA